MLGPWPLVPPEVLSAAFWNGPGASSLASTGAALIAKGSAYEATASGLGANTAAVQAAWQSLAGSATVPPALGRVAWHAVAGGLHQANGGILEGLASTWEGLRAATPTPAEVAANRATDVSLNSHNFLGMLTPAIVANNAVYVGKQWVPASANMTAWNTVAEAGIGSMQPIPPAPLMTTNPGVTEPSAPQVAQQASSKTAGGGASTQMLSGATSILPSLAQLPMLLSQVPSSFAQLPMGLGQQLVSGPMQLSGMMSTLMQGKGLGIGPGALGGNSTGGIKAGLGGVGSGAGVGGGGAPSLRLPGALSVPAGGLDATAVSTPPSRASKLEAARTPGSTATSGGTVGAVPMSAAARAAQHGEEQQHGTGKSTTTRAQLAAATHIPIITGSGQYTPAEETETPQVHTLIPSPGAQVWQQSVRT